MKVIGYWVPTLGVLQVKFKCSPTHGERARTDYSRLVGVSFNKQRYLHWMLVLEGCKMSKPLHSSSQNLKYYIEALT